MQMIRTMLLGLCLINSAQAAHVEHLLWEKVPLTIHLPINEERLVYFNEPIKLLGQSDVPALNILKVKDRLYLKAYKAFKHIRVIVHIPSRDEIVLLNLKAEGDYKTTTPIEIITENKTSKSQSSPSHYEYNAIQLTRFAIHQLYSPERLQKISTSIVRDPMHTHKTVTLFYGASIEAHPIASWRSNYLYVTAVELKNLLNKSITLKPKDLLGNWQTASFYPSHHLKPRSQHHSTTIFLVSNKPFSESLKDIERYHR